LVELSKFTVPVVMPDVRFAVIVTALPTTCVEAGLTTRPTEALTVPVTKYGKALLVEVL
jgi:hypothetical protein